MITKKSMEVEQFIWKHSFGMSQGIRADDDPVKLYATYSEPKPISFIGIWHISDFL